MVKKVIKGILIWSIGIVVALYTTFVVQSLWNWFVTEAFHLSPISFWVTYGIVLVIRLLGQKTRTDEMLMFEVLGTKLDACIPDDKQEVVEKKVKEMTGATTWVFTFAGDFVGNTFTLVVGWIVHVFLA